MLIKPSDLAQHYLAYKDTNTKVEYDKGLIKQNEENCCSKRMRSDFKFSDPVDAVLSNNNNYVLVASQILEMVCLAVFKDLNMTNWLKTYTAVSILNSKISWAKYSEMLPKISQAGNDYLEKSKLSDVVKMRGSASKAIKFDENRSVLPSDIIKIIDDINKNFIEVKEALKYIEDSMELFRYQRASTYVSEKDASKEYLSYLVEQFDSKGLNVFKKIHIPKTNMMRIGFARKMFGTIANFSKMQETKMFKGNTENAYKALRGVFNVAKRTVQSIPIEYCPKDLHKEFNKMLNYQYIAGLHSVNLEEMKARSSLLARMCRIIAPFVIQKGIEEESKWIYVNPIYASIGILPYKASCDEYLYNIIREKKCVVKVRTTENFLLEWSESAVSDHPIEIGTDTVQINSASALIPKDVLVIYDKQNIDWSEYMSTLKVTLSRSDAERVIENYEKQSKDAVIKCVQEKEAIKRKTVDGSRTRMRKTTRFDQPPPPLTSTQDIMNS